LTLSGKGSRDSRLSHKERRTANSRCGIVTVVTLYTSHCQLPNMVWSLQQVEVWPSTEEEEEEEEGHAGATVPRHVHFFRFSL